MDPKEQENFKILSNFQIDSKPISCTPFGNGHINKTYEVKTEKGGHYILQKVNDNVFKNVEMLMENINYVSSYLIENGFESLKIIKTKDGKIYDKENGQFFRVYIFSPNSIYFEKAEMDSLIKETSEAYGDLHNNLSGIDASKLGEVIPDFHNTEKRFENFLKAVEINYKNRKEICQKEIDEIISFKKYFSVINEGLANKEINYTVTHNDPKINNVLFDKDTLKFKCVVDLDTVMPGTILYDFGDGLRSLFTGDNECSKDLSKLKVNFKMYELYLNGYAKKMKKTLTKKEIELLPFSIFLMAIELAIRFLDDFLRGDVYFGIHNEDDNLTRARTQLTLAKDIYNNLDLLNKKTKEIIDSIN
jgi:Ser/Thr protein kinase RdoA (MazF antagonist)